MPTSAAADGESAGVEGGGHASDEGGSRGPADQAGRGRRRQGPVLAAAESRAGGALRTAARRDAPPTEGTRFFHL